MINRELFIILTDNDIVQKSDAIILLEGDGLNRYKEAVKLFKNGYASKIVFSGGTTDYNYGSFPWEHIKPLIIAEGVPEDALLHESVSQNTKDQADEVLNLCLKHNWRRIILVASHYHQYRAYLTFLKVAILRFPNLLIYNSPVRELEWFSENVWGSRFSCLKGEFERIEKYYDLGHLASYEEAIKYQQWKEQQ